MSIKLQLYIGAIFIAPVMVLVVDVQAETPNCLPLLECPPVLACQEGYSCQPDPVEPPPPPVGEQQQYPPDTAEAWVFSIVGSNLANVSLDDPRWGNREEGEVYARENDQAIVWYWPKGGSATFDPTKLGSHATWYDYRLSQPGGEPRGGNLNLSAGMRIQFIDSGNGGISIFEKINDVSPPAETPHPPQTGYFLGNYNNPKQVKLPADKVYPIGQKMPMSAYSASDSQLRATAKAGMTMMGPDYHGRGPETSKQTFRVTLPTSLGFTGYYRLRISGNSSWSDLSAMMKTDEGKTKLKNQVTAHINDVLNDPQKNNAVYAWYGYHEEVIHRTGKSYTLEDQRNYHRFVHDIIKQLDPRKRPYYVSERRDSGAANMAGNACFQDGVMKQDALIADSGYTSDIEVRGIMRKWGIDTVKTAFDADKLCPSYTGKPRAAISTLSSAWDPSDPANKNEAWLRKIITYDVYVHLAVGIDGFNVYTYGAKLHSTAALQQRLYNEILGGIVKDGLGKVFLWGEDRNDVKIMITSGPKTSTWSLFGKTHVDPSIDMRNIQYGDNRYILLVNSAKKDVTVKLSGIPAGLKITDLVKGGAGSTTTTIRPLGVRMYKVSK